VIQIVHLGSKFISKLPKKIAVTCKYDLSIGIPLNFVIMLKHALVIYEDKSL